MEQCEGNKLILDKNSKTNALPPGWDYSAPLPLPRTTLFAETQDLQILHIRGRTNLGSFKVVCNFIQITLSRLHYI